MAQNLEDTELARRAFLAKCGKYALVTPPVVTLMLSVSGTNNYALALSGSTSSGGGGGGGGGGSASNGGGGGGGPNNPGILQSRGGSANNDANANLDCRTERAMQTSWRQNCQRPDRPNFEIDSAGPAAG